MQSSLLDFLKATFTKRGDGILEIDADSASKVLNTEILQLLGYLLLLASYFGKFGTDTLSTLEPSSTDYFYSPQEALPPTLAFD